MKPLAGTRVVGLVTNLPGPIVLHRLHDLGAQATKVEPPGGDALARSFPNFYEMLTAGQRILNIDLKDYSKLEPLLAESDLLITTMRPKTLERLDLGWSGLQIKFPRLAHLSIVGYGAPDQDRPGHDLTYQAVKGFVKPPNLPENTWADLAGSLGAYAAALLLIAEIRVGRFHHQEISLSESLKEFMLPTQMGLTADAGVLRGALPNYQIYEASEGWVALAALEHHFWEKFQQLNGLEHAREPELKNLFKKKTSEEWENWAKSHDLPLVRVRELDMES